MQERGIKKGWSRKADQECGRRRKGDEGRETKEGRGIKDGRPRMWEKKEGR
jgi:hypothetical protein